MQVSIDLSNGECIPIRLSQLKGFIGQEGVVKKIKFFARSSSDETPFPTLLFTGSHGLGKTYLAEKVAKVLGRKFIPINCGAMKKRDDFLDTVVDNVRGPSTIFLDESHNLSTELTTVLLTLLNPSTDSFNCIQYRDYKLMYSMKRINVVFASTDSYIMFRPLVNRCQKVYFEAYGQKSIIEMLQFYLDDIKLDCDLDDLSDACRSRARDAFILSQNIKRYMRLNNKTILSQQEWEEVKCVFDIFHKGLRKEEISLLEEIRDNGPISCANLALRLMVNESNVKSEMEVRLRELGLITSSSRGRIITSEGLRYFNLLDR